jgi:para-nitrobenzyl esterase
MNHSPTDDPPGEDPVVTTEDGALRGVRTAHGAVFKGIPYAAPPVGELRFRPPHPPERWDGVRDAVEWGPVSAQVADPLERYPSEPEMLDSPAAGMEVPVHLSEDSLCLNVWTPDPDGPPRPVMVFIHGGAFVVGTSSCDFYTGEHLARHDVVVVTFNYRLGVFGFLELGGLDESYRGSGNNGLRDQVAALEWVRRNVAAFGGDPDRVTVFGESAGSISISALLATSDPSRLFDQVIAQSGGPNLVHTAAFQDLAADAVFDAAREVGIEDVLAAPTAQLVEAGFVASLRSPFADTLFAPYIDGELVLGDAYDRLRDGAAAGIPMMAGATQDEMGYWSMYDSRLRNYFVEETDFGDPVGFPDTVRARLDEVLGAGAFDAVYADWVTEHDPPRGLRDDATTALLTQAHDYVMILPMTHLAEAQVGHAPTWLYRFAWKVPAGLLESPEQDLGAIHALELPFVFGTFDISAPCGERVVEDPEQLTHAQDLSRTMLAAWTNFARTGDPNGDGVPAWPAYDLDERSTIVWRNDADGAITTAVVADPDASRRRAWATFDFPPFG